MADWVKVSETHTINLDNVLRVTYSEHSSRVFYSAANGNLNAYFDLEPDESEMLRKALQPKLRSTGGKTYAF